MYMYMCILIHTLRLNIVYVLHAPHPPTPHILTHTCTDSSSPLSLEDSELVTGLLETTVVLWEGVRERMEKPGNKQLKKKLITTFAASMPLLFDTFKVTTVIYTHVANLVSKIISYWWNGPSWEILPFTVHPEFQLVCWPEFPTNFYIHYTCTYRQNYIKYSLSFSLSHTLQDGPSRSALYLLASYLPKRSVLSISKGTLVALSSLRYPVKSHDYTSLLVALVAWKQAADVVKLTNQWLAPQLSWQVVAEGGMKCSNGLDENCMQNATHPKKKVCVGGCMCTCMYVQLCVVDDAGKTYQAVCSKPN